MDYTVDELNSIVDTLQTLINNASDTIKGLPVAYVSKLQWKQLDNIRSGQIVETNKRIDDLEANGIGTTGTTGTSGTGAKGDKGDRGLTGLTGPKGDDGVDGANGIQGISGIKGDKGDTGNTGAIGSTGAKGDKGDIGTDGSKGAQGDTGLTGVTGAKGDQGIQGIQGITGAKGDTGAQGPAGSIDQNVVQNAVDITIDGLGGVANGIATLDAGGKIPSSQIPPIAIVDVNVVATIAARNLLTVQSGDCAHVTADGNTYMWSGTTSSWIQLTSSTGVTTVNGLTGTVSLTTDNIAEGALNKYYTDAKVTAVINLLKSVTNGIASLDGTGKVPSIQLPTYPVVPGNTDSLTEGSTNKYYTDVRADARISAQKATASGLATLDGTGKVPVAQLPTSVVSPTTTDGLTEGATNLYSTSARIDARITAAKAVANGVATLDGGTKIPIAQIPAAALPPSNTDSLTEGSTNKYYTDVRADARITVQKAQVNGLASLGSDGKVPTGQLPSSTGGTASGTTVDASGFNKNLTTAETDVQKALTKIDQLTVSGGSTAVRTNTTVDAATITPNIDTTDVYTITGIAQAFTVAAPTGTPVNGQKFLLRIHDNGTSRNIVWNAIYRGVGVTPPAVTALNKILYVGMIYNSVDTKWDVIAIGQEGLGGVTDSPIGEIYSTTETAIGVWIDGKTLYRKVINFGACPNATTKSVAHGIANVAGVVKIYGFMYAAATPTAISPIPFTNSSGSYQVNPSTDATNVTLVTGYNWSAQTAVMIIEYTCTDR